VSSVLLECDCKWIRKENDLRIREKTEYLENELCTSLGHRKDIHDNHILMLLWANYYPREILVVLRINYASALIFTNGGEASEWLLNRDKVKLSW